MTRREERKLFEKIDALYDVVHENNKMLRQLVRVVNTYLSRHHQENEDDFNRNVMANMVSEIINKGLMFGRRV